MYSHIIVVTGARTWRWRELIERAFNDAWRSWGPANITSPLLVSGHCPNGADRLAEEAWVKAGFGAETMRLMPADWASDGRGAGMMRNQAMVDFVASQVANGTTQALVTAFFSLCTRTGCSQAAQEQLLPPTPGHFSHGTSHCYKAAKKAGLATRVVLDPGVVPF